MAFNHNSKAKLLAGVVADNMDYIKASKSYMSQSELEGKKFGASYKIYLPDPGRVLQGTEADPDTIDQVVVEVDYDNYNTSTTLSAWSKLQDVESFVDEIAKPRGVNLARTEEKKIVEKNVFRSAQAVVGQANFATLSDAASALGELSVPGDKVSFLAPTVMGKIANGGLANFVPNQAAKDLYTKNYLGEYGGASQVQLAVLPVIKTCAGQSATITLSKASAADKYFKPVTSIAGTFVAGSAFKADGLKIVDCSGLPTDQDYIIICDKDGNIPVLRISEDLGNDAAGNKINGFQGNPNAWVAAGTSSLTLTPILDDEKSYYVGQVRTSDCLAYDSYKFQDLPGSENEGVGTVGGVTVHMSQYGDGKGLTKLVRLDAPYAAAIVEPRHSVTVYIAK